MSKIIVALDFYTAKEALEFVEQIHPELCKLKVGMGLFTHSGPDLVRKLIQKGFDVFLDLKFHDIPNTVAAACAAAADLGVWMVNIHASGGFKMMQAARAAIDKSVNKPKLIAVTVLTSLNAQECNEVGVNTPIKDHVLKLAQLAHEADLDGVVCSAEEAPLLKKCIGKEFFLVTPGIRLETSPADDQKRIVTPKQAILQGANFLVIGRPIIQAKNPIAVLQEIIGSMQM